MMTFPAFWFFGFLNYAGWPRTKGLLVRKKVVNYTVFCSAIIQLVKAGIALGSLRPQIAVSLLADLFGKRDWSQQPATELWPYLDPSDKVADNSDKYPEEAIAGIEPPLYNHPEEWLRDFVEWEFLLTDSFSAHYHYLFVQGLIWGFSYPEEAMGCYEEKRQRFFKNLPEMLKTGIKVHSPETLEEFADAVEESVNSFQNEVRPLAEVPQELLDLPAINVRISQPEVIHDIHVAI
ncbi:MAG: hypothetical protein A2167_03415 [Planctomycetes bacterium RBG_13_46_10]|nr:MAG: hypothetical protein A2167_03415 [Planctomycetes bacterium RBG_13_46_10]